MICYFVCKQHQYTIEPFLAGWGESLASRVAVVPYESLGVRPTIPAASSYIFSDIERLSPTWQTVSLRVCEHLEAEAAEESANAPRLLNHPARTCRRYELLTKLYDQGVNDFRVHRLDESIEAWRYPVFLRMANDHEGNRTPLLHGPGEVRQAIANLRQQGVRLCDVIATEFCDTSTEDGIHRKYGAFVVGSQIIPRHLMFGKQWMLKQPDMWNDRLRDEQRAYLETNPHAAELQKICAAAGVDYGRVDYGFVAGRVRVWEINTNPTIQQLVYPTLRDPYTHQLFAERICAAFGQLAAGPTRNRPTRLWDLPVHVVGATVNRWSRKGARLLLKGFHP